MGDLSRRKIERDQAVVGLFSHHGVGQQGRQRGPQGAVGKTVRLIDGRPRLQVAGSWPNGRLDRVPDFTMLVQEAGGQAPGLCAPEIYYRAFMRSCSRIEHGTVS